MSTQTTDPTKLFKHWEEFAASPEFTQMEADYAAGKNRPGEPDFEINHSIKLVTLRGGAIKNDSLRIRAQAVARKWPTYNYRIASDVTFL